MSHRRGFTLVEMSIVLVIVGFLMTGAFQLMITLRDNNQLRETREQVESAKEAVIGFAAVNRRLPRFDTTTPAPDNDEFTPLLKGVTDLWGSRLVYLYDPVLAAPANPNIVCGARTTALTIRTCPDIACAAPDSTTNNVAFAVFSRGANAVNQTAASTAPVPASQFGGPAPTTPASPFSTYSPGLQVGQYDAPNATPVAYDDVLTYITLEELRQKAGCVGTQLRITNNELPFGSVGTPYNATVFAEGGVPFPAGGNYRWCIQGVLPGGVVSTPALPVCTANEVDWVQGDSLQFTQPPTAPGSFQLVISVRDNADAAGANDNTSAKTFVLTVNP